MAGFDPYLKSTVTVGPPIVLNDLLVYYDFSNPNCYNPNINNLLANNLVAGTNALSATLVQLIPNNLPSYDQVYPQNLVFDGVNDYMQYTVTLTNPNAPFTAIIIGKSNTSTWSWSGASGTNPPYDYATFIASTNANRGFSLDGYSGNSYPPGTFGGIQPGPLSMTAYYSPTTTTRPGFYAISSNGTNNHRYYVAGGLKSTSTTSQIRTSGSMTVYVGAGDQVSYPNSRFSAVSIFAHLLYDRQLTDVEILDNYNALKVKYNLF